MLEQNDVIVNISVLFQMNYIYLTCNYNYSPTEQSTQHHNVKCHSRGHSNLHNF